MKNLMSKKLISVITMVLLFPVYMFPQFDDVDFLRSAPADGVKFLEAYLTPWANAFSAGLNGSWYNTAKPHKWTGFDVTLGVNTGIVPSSAETFDVESAGFSSSLSGTGKAPTIAGPSTAGPPMTYSESGVTLASFETPPGTEWRYIPVPTLQVGIGLPLGTELKARFLPRIPIEEGDVMLWGAGLMHSITQYIPGSELLPFDVSLFGGYTWLNGNVPIKLMPDLSANWNYIDIDPYTYFNDQILSATVQAWNVCAIASANLRVLTFYGGLGYSNTLAKAELEGYYPLPVVAGGTTGEPYVEYNESAESLKKGEDFPSVEIENFSGLRANLGVRLKLAVVTIHVDYTRSQYNVLSAGLGISFR
ncbi:MAG TPA: hypothetical protein PLQ06_04475 [Bacteroidales bacterium]|nr:hypothetical protein [Bacteroidales bacterium]